MAQHKRLYTYNIKSNMHSLYPDLQHDGPVGYQTDSVATSKPEPSIGRFANKMDIKPPKHKTESKKKKKQKKKETDSEEKHPSPTSSIEQSYSEAATKAINGIKAFGFSEEELLMSVTQLKAAEVPITIDSLLDKVYDVQDQLLSLPSSSSSSESSLDDKHLPNSSSVKHKGSLQTDGAPGSDGEDTEDESDSCSVSSLEDSHTQQYQKAIDSERERLQDAIDGLIIRCRVCNTSRATILLLPCGHLVSCEDCLMDVRRCPIPRCNKVVRGTKEVFFA